MARKEKSLPYNKSWTTFTNNCIQVFFVTLDLLIVTAEMKKNENKISKVLYKEMKDVCFKNKVVKHRPFWDAKIDDTEKRPDFTYGFNNSLAKSAALSEIDLHIECKCIGNNRSHSWSFNNNYINNGIKRFDSLTHEYGKNAFDGIMIGYIISSNKSDIQNEINGKLPQNIEKLDFKNGNKVEKISTKFMRENVKPSDFTMHHIWADYTE